MFDIAFTEILLIAAVALIVIGPERLPGVARTLGHLIGRMQRYVNDVKADIQREIELDELKKLRKDMEDSARSIEDTAREFESSINRQVNATQDELRALETLSDREPATAPDAAPPTRPPAESGADAPAAQGAAKSVP